MQRFAKNYPGAGPYRWEFSNLLERLNERLRTLGGYGLVISGQQTEHREGIQRDMANSKRYGTGGHRSQKLERILDTAHFVDSKLSRMIQLADMAAFILRRRATRRSEDDARLEAVMERPLPTGLRRHPRAPGPVPHDSLARGSRTCRFSTPIVPPTP